MTGGTDPDHVAVVRALEIAGDLLASAVVNTNEALEFVASGEAAMTIAPDSWARGFLEDKNLSTNDIMLTHSPGSQERFVFGSSAFVLSSEAPHPNAATCFLSLVGSEVGQRAFHSRDGTLPARLGLDFEPHDASTRQFMIDYQVKEVMPAFTGAVPFDFVIDLFSVMEIFETDRDVDKVVQWLRENYHRLQ